MRQIAGCLCIGFLMSANAASAELPDDFAIKTLHIKSDNNLNAKRIGCAFGDMPKILGNLAADGYPTPDVTDYCVAVMQEAAKRGNLGDLYTRMQPDAFNQEIKKLFTAARNNQISYVNVENVTKDLNCELAFDVGYGWGNNSPNQAIAPNISNHKIDEITRDCFDKTTQTSTRDGLIAGARVAQAHANGKRILHSDISQ